MLLLSRGAPVSQIEKAIGVKRSYLPTMHILLQIRSEYLELTGRDNVSFSVEGENRDVGFSLNPITIAPPWTARSIEAHVCTFGVNETCARRYGLDCRFLTIFFRNTGMLSQNEWQY
jgi:hypothetical protein